MQISLVSEKSWWLGVFVVLPPRHEGGEGFSADCADFRRFDGGETGRAGSPLPAERVDWQEAARTE